MKRWQAESILGRRWVSSDPAAALVLAIAVGLIAVSFALWMGAAP